MSRTFASLSRRNYRLYFAGQVVSVSGTWMQRLAQDWLILQLTDSAIALSIGVALQFAPLLLLGLWGGVVVDRTDRRRLLVWVQSVMGLLALVLGLLTLTGVVTLWMVYALTLALGVATVFDQPARQSFVTELVGGGGVANAVSLNSSVNQVAKLVGPAIAGLVITAWGVAPAFLVNAATYVAVVAALVAMDPEELQHEARVARGPRQLREGVRYALATPRLRAPLVLILIVSMLAQNFRVVLPLVATDVFDAGAGAYSLFLSALGVGALVGALLCAHFARPTQRLVLVLASLFGAANLAAAAAPSMPVLVVLLVVVGAGSTAFNSTSNALVQLRSIGPMRGRVLALRGLLFLGTTPIGGPVIGWICATYGARAGFVAGGAAAVVAAVALLPSRHLDAVASDEAVVAEPDAAGV